MELEVNQFCLFKVIFKLLQPLFLILTNMGTHLSQCFCNRIREDGSILPRNSKIEITLSFLTILVVQHTRSSELLGASPPIPPPGTCLGPSGGFTAAPRPHLDKAIAYGHRTDRANVFFFIYILAGSYDFCRLVTAGVLTFWFQKRILHRPCLYTVNIARPLILAGVMLPVFSVILEYRMNGRNSSDRPTVRPQSSYTACAFCTLAISKQTQTRSSSNHTRQFQLLPEHAIRRAQMLN